MKAYYLYPRWVYENYGKNKDLLYAYETIVYLTRFTPGIISGIEVNAELLLMSTKEPADSCKLSHSSMRSALRRFVRDGGIKTENLEKKAYL